MELEKIEVPDTYYYKVKMGKMFYEIELETLVAVMANQIISSNPSMYLDGDHEVP